MASPKVGWNYDHGSRRAWPGTPPEPEDRRPTHDRLELWKMAQDVGVENLGDPQAAAARWPPDRIEALECLNAFIKDAPARFGSYEDV